MNKRIVYLLGAGASINCIPEVNNLNNGFISLRGTLKGVYTELENKGRYLLAQQEVQERLTALKHIENELTWLIDNSSEFTTIDDFAANLQINGSMNILNRLKNILSFYFEMTQYLNKPDPRYKQFLLRTMITQNNSLPDNIHILNWNYDFQIEKSYGDIKKHHDILAIKSKLNIYSKGELQSFDPNRFGVIKLNGTAGFFEKENSSYDTLSTTLNPNVDIDFWGSISLNFYNLTKTGKYVSGLSYHFEKSELAHKIQNSIMSVCNFSTHLVVIGYSFQPTNLELDKNILEAMRNLRSIIIVDPQAEVIKERMLNIYEELKECKFYFPNEYSSFPTPNIVN